MPSHTPDALTTLSDLVAAHGRDVRYWSGYVDALGVRVYRGPNNSKAIDAKGYAKLVGRLKAGMPVESR